MPRLRQLALLLPLLLAASPLLAKNSQQPPSLRWQEGAAGCRLDKEQQDELYRYTLDSPEFRISMAVESTELARTQKTAGHVLSLQLSIESKVTTPLNLKATQATLEFVRHHRWQFQALTPAVLNSRIQDTTDELMHQTEKVGVKHPEKVAEQEERLREYQKLVSEMIEFATSQGLEDATLDTTHPKISGWLFFPTRGKWVAEWKNREDFVLRIPVGAGIVEFPFTLPPQERPTLKQRPD